MQKKDIYQDVTNRIIEALESGKVAPWHKPWKANGISGGDRNAISGHTYRGINTMLLWIAADEKGFTSPLWLTFRQAKANGGSVLKGSKGTQIIFWKPIKVTDKDTGEVKTIPMAKGYTVFNIEQTENVKLPKKHQASEESTDAAAVTGMDHIDELITAHNVDLRNGGDRAFYAPSKDCIQLPTIESFDTVDLYYGTLLHELTHWTSHVDRCNRRDQLGKRFGDHAYAFEELVAEIGSAMTSTILGLDVGDYHHATSYIDHWLRVLKGDNRAIFKASSLAQKASDFILQPEAVESEESQAA